MRFRLSDMIESESEKDFYDDAPIYRLSKNMNWRVEVESDIM